MKPIKVSHRIALDDSWRQDFIDQLGAIPVNNRQFVLPGDIATGCSYLMEVMPGLVVLIVDFIYHKQVEFTKLASADEFCIAYYDMNSQISLHHVHGSKHKVGYQSKLGFGIVDAALKSTYIPPTGERTYSFRLLISKAILKKYLHGSLAESMTSKVFDGKKNTIFYYGHIKSSTRITLKSLMDCSYEDPCFELMLKGVALNTFGHLLELMTEKGPVVIKPLTENMTSPVITTQTYLMTQLMESFPGIEFLAKMAGMSVSKYNILFKKLFKTSPKQFFLNEKMLLAQKLLSSGNYHSINEVAYEIGFGKPGYFAKKYKDTFGNLPSEIFIPGIQQ